MSVFSFLKWVFVALAMFAVYTASPDQRSAMLQGVQAFGLALVSACTRPESPCTRAIRYTRSKIIDDPTRTHAGDPGAQPFEPQRDPYATRTPPPYDPGSRERFGNGTRY